MADKRHISLAFGYGMWNNGTLPPPIRNRFKRRRPPGMDLISSAPCLGDSGQSTIRRAGICAAHMINQRTARKTTA